MKKNTVVLMIVILLSKIIGMFRDIILAYYYGTSNVSDAYLIAVSVPTLLFYYICHSLSTSYIPMYNKIKIKKGLDAANYYSNNIMNISLLLCILIVSALIIFPLPIIKLFAAGFDKETAQLAANFIRICSPSIFLMLIINIFSSYLQINDNFLAPAIVSVPRNIIIIISIIIAAIHNEFILGLGILLAYVGEYLFLAIFAMRSKYKYKPYINFKDKEIKETLYLILPILIGTSFNQINKMINRSIASTIAPGAVSALNYASVINNAVQEVLITGIITILFTNCTMLVANNQHQKVKNNLSATIDTMILLLMPATIGIIVLAKPIVIVFFSRGNFYNDSVSLTASALIFYSISITFLAIRDALIKIFYAYNNTKIPTITSIIVILINIVLNLIFSQLIGVSGLALATSISAIFQCVLLYIFLRRKIGDFSLRSTLKTTVKVNLSSLIMGILVYFINIFFMKIGWSITLSLLATVFTGIIIYGILCLFVKIEPFMQIVNKYIRKKIHNKN